MQFDEKLMQLRRQRGMSQEQLANQLGVTRQSVSKWESGQALPELAKIITISELFEVSVDYLVKEYIEEIESPGFNETVPAANVELENKVDKIYRYMKGYHFTSKTKVFGIPLVSIRLSRNLGGNFAKDHVAKGIVAIGNVSIGVVSIGLLSVGIVSFGCLAVGLLALGALAFGIAAMGSVAVGILAFGPVAVGIYAGGVAVFGAEISAGVAARGKTVIGENISGIHQLKYYEGITELEIQRFLAEYHPKLWSPLVKFFTVIGRSIG